MIIFCVLWISIVVVWGGRGAWQEQVWHTTWRDLFGAWGYRINTRQSPSSPWRQSKGCMERMEWNSHYRGWWECTRQDKSDNEWRHGAVKVPWKRLMIMARRRKPSTCVIGGKLCCPFVCEFWQCIIDDAVMRPPAHKNGADVLMRQLPSTRHALIASYYTLNLSIPQNGVLWMLVDGQEYSSYVYLLRFQKISEYTFGAPSLTSLSTITH